MYIDGIKVHETDPEKQPQPPSCEPKPYDAKAAKPPKGAVVLFDGTQKTLKKLAGNQWRSNEVEISGRSFGICPGGGYLQSKKEFGSCKLHIEFATPREAKGEWAGAWKQWCLSYGAVRNSGFGFLQKYYLSGRAVRSPVWRAKPLVNASVGVRENGNPMMLLSSTHFQ